MAAGGDRDAARLGDRSRRSSATRRASSTWRSRSTTARAGARSATRRSPARALSGDRVLLNTTAVDLSLGTGGLHFVVARAGTGQGVALDEPSGGHVMKLRYTPLQRDVLVGRVAGEPAPRRRWPPPTTSAGMPVVCCGLHSQVPLVAAAVKQADPRSASRTA